jgi:hypothetical protein
LVEGVERLGGSDLGLGDEQGSLTEVIEDQRRQHGGKPRDSDGSWTEMSHIRVQSFASGHRQHHGTQDDQTDFSMSGKERQTVRRVEGFQDFRSHPDAPDSKEGNDHEPYECDWTEDSPHLRSSGPLGCEQQQDDAH